MTSTVPKQKSSPRPPSRKKTAAPVEPPIRGRRNPKWIALGIIAVCLGALASYFVYSQVSHAQSVIAVSTTVHRGDTVKAADLTTVTVGSVPGVTTVPAGQLSSIVGKTTAYDLVGGSILPAGAISNDPVPAKERAVVGIRLVSGRAPLDQLTASSPIRLVALPPAGADSSAKDAHTGQVIIAKVVSQSAGSDGNSILLNVDVPAAKAPDVALLAAQERIAVVRDSDE